MLKEHEAFTYPQCNEMLFTAMQNYFPFYCSGIFEWILIVAWWDGSFSRDVCGIEWKFKKLINENLTTFFKIQIPKTIQNTIFNEF
jgi:hypothetical protein